MFEKSRCNVNTVEREAPSILELYETAGR